MGEGIVSKPLSSHVFPDFTTRTSPEIKGVKGGGGGGGGCVHGWSNPCGGAC